MNRRDLPLNALRSFEAVARHLSFSRAAEELGVTHGAVSRQISTLEEWLGRKLFDRRSGVVLSDVGQQLFEGVAPAFDRMAATLERCGHQDVRGVLRVNAPPTFTMKWLIPRLSGFQRRHREVDLRLATGTGALQTLKMNEVDVVIRRMAAGHGDPQGTPFLSGALVAVCAPELLERHPVVAAADVAHHPLIEAATGSVGWTEWFAQAGCPLPPAARFQRFEEMFYALQAALDGLGVALIPSALVVDDLAAGRLAVAWPVPGVHERAYMQVVSPLARDTAAVAAFTAWLQAEGGESNRLVAQVLPG